MNQRMYKWIIENKRKGKKKYETKDKTFLNELTTVRFLTLKRTPEKSMDASQASEILHSTRERDEVVVLQESCFLWRPLV
jgi:hypothetical protein